MTSPGFKCTGGLEGFMNDEMQSHGDKTCFGNAEWTTTPAEDRSQPVIVPIMLSARIPTGREETPA